MSTTQDIRRVAILFAGGPAPAANAVISSAALAFLKAGVEVLGFLHGYSSLVDYDAETAPLVEGQAYIKLDRKAIEFMRTEGGIRIGTARANPGKGILGRDDLKDADKAAPLKRCYEGLMSLGVDALISIGGDDTLKTANKFHLYQVMAGLSKKIRVVHLPKTIDNDYNGIDFTFGYFTAVHWMADAVQNLLQDARAGRAYFIVECMGRKAGWLSYGVAMASEAQLVIGVEDIAALMHKAGRDNTAQLDLDVLVDHIVDLVADRKARHLNYGVVILAEGLVEKLPQDYLASTSKDDHGHISLGDIQLGHLVAKRVAARILERGLTKTKVNGIQLGYEARCARPHAFDVMLGSQLGVGAYSALVEKGLDGYMVSSSGQLDNHFVPFEQLVDPKTLITEVRFIEPGCNFHRLAHLLGDSELLRS